MELTAAGRLLYGRYRLGTVVGRGDLGVVWQARDELLERDVAVKELIWPPHFTAAQRQSAGRLAVQEAQLAGRLVHPNAIRIYDILQEDGHPWIIMELLLYPSLRDLVRKDGPLTPEEAAHIGLGILAVLRAAHEAGMLHRDVRPANILVGSDGRVVLTDFGIARAVDAYLPASGGRAGPAQDLWGLGISLYTAVAGHPPFERDDPAAVHAGPLWPAISGLLREDPADRIDAAEAERLLAEVAGPAASAPAPAPDSGPDPDPASSIEQPLVAAPAEVPAARPPWSGRLAGALIALSALAVALTALVFAVTSWPSHTAALPGGIAPTEPAASNPGASPDNPTPGAPVTASAPPSASTVPGSVASGIAAGGNQPSSPGPAIASVSVSKGPPSPAYGALPAGYYRFTDPTGFSIGVPSGWQISHTDGLVYITDPSDSGIFLLIDQSGTPDQNPLADWQQQAADRAGTYPDYQLVRLASVPFAQAEKAADWEFTYVRDGVPVHILNRNVLANANHAYALYWSTPETAWTADYHYFATFAATFSPAP